MSIARHHAEWLSLLEISGPFLSMPVLMNALPHGLDAHDPEHVRELRAVYDEWADNQAGLRPDPAIHTAWVRYVLENTLAFPAEVIAAGQTLPAGLKTTVPEHGITLRPDLAIVDPADKKPRLLIRVYPPAQSPEKAVSGSPWQTSPATRMMMLLHATGVQLGLITNGEEWMLVNAPVGETTGFITWYAALWLEEPLTLRAFRTLLGVERFFNVPDDQTLAALLTASIKDQHEVTDQLGYQVRRAVEILIQAMDRADQDRGRTLLTGIDETTLYEAALTVMMRLVFLLTAEERKLLPLDDPFYSENYAVSTLRTQQSELADTFGEELLDYRYDAWSRLLATFRAVHGGLYHDRLTIPAYGGSLFDPDRFPFLEGRSSEFGVQSSEFGEKLGTQNSEPGTRNSEPGTQNPKPGTRNSTPATPIPVSNRTVLHLLNALQLLQVKVPGGGPAEARRLSYRALDIEQIGHVYESLLDHTAVRAAEPVLGLTGTKNKEPEIPLSALEAFRDGTGWCEKDLLDFLKEQTGRSISALKKALPGAADSGKNSKNNDPRNSKLRVACGNDESLYRRVRPWAALIRDDDFNQPVVIPAGSVYVTAGTERRATGTHYTPRALTEPIVQHTLEPLIYRGPAEGLPREKWRLRPPADLLDLKICDMAMGSGAFLMQTCRYLSERLVEAWNSVVSGSKFQVSSSENPSNLKPETLNPKLRITPEGKPATGDPGEQLIPADPDEQLIFAKRLIADRCLYGVDKNPLAVEMAKLSLWLVTMDKNRPFTFLDHALKCGDSLVGVNLDQLLTWNLAGEGKRRFETMSIQVQIERMIALRRQLETIPVNSIADQEQKRILFEEAEAVAHDLKRGGDMLIGSYFNDLKKDEQEALHQTLLLAFRDGTDVPPERAAQADLGDLRPFHWQLEFPEVFLAEGRAVIASKAKQSPRKSGKETSRTRAGFDAFVGNPPFIGGRRIRETMGDDYRELLYEMYPGSSGNADYSAFFFLRGFRHLRTGGTLGLIATNTIAQGDTRQTGLDTITNEGGVIFHAVNNHPWPGTAAVVVNIVHLCRGQMKPPFVLDNQTVQHISSLLDGRRTLGEPYRLAANREKSFQGSVVVGKGFILTPEEAQALIEKDPRNKDVLFPYLNGKDLNSNPD